MEEDTHGTFPLGMGAEYGHDTRSLVSLAFLTLHNNSSVRHLRVAPQTHFTPPRVLGVEPRT
jgi:hypothetical protein